MERRIRPWINKKIAEYIGEPEPILVDFICSKILVGSTPQAILDDVQTVSELGVTWCVCGGGLLVKYGPGRGFGTPARIRLHSLLRESNV